MNILMVTNTYLPHVGGVAHSVSAFSEAYRKLGHRVVVVCPTFENAPRDELDVVRVPAVQNFNGSDFSVQIPLPTFPPLEGFTPDVVHSHHPFLLGGTALRFAAAHNVPAVFTHHTMYERYTHYVPGNSPEMKKFVIELSTGYANLCQRVIAPSESAARILRERGVETPIAVVPTGIEPERFSPGEGTKARAAYNIPPSAFVVGHVGRLAPEKNLHFLARAVCRFLLKHPEAHFLVVGGGPSAAEIEGEFKKARLLSRLHLVGPLRGGELTESYRAMNVFAFSSFTETQGVVLAEALSCGVPVVALDAPGAREVVQDQLNGRLLKTEDTRDFAAALEWVRIHEGSPLRERVLESALPFSLERCAERGVGVYQEAISTHGAPIRVESSVWDSAVRQLEAEWSIAVNTAHAVGQAMLRSRLLASPPVRWLRRTARRIERAADRSEWVIRALGLKTFEAGNEAGLILIQIDGLAKEQLETALYRRRMPFCQSLLHREGYQMVPVYSGVPSTTPAVQGELFYGVRGVVPSFEFFDRRSKSVMRMFEPSSAAKIEEELKARGAGLLQGGSCYSSIYTGGAENAHFCPASFGWGAVLQAVNPLTLLVLVAWHSWSVVKLFALLLVEAAISAVDVVRGVSEGHHLWQEVKFLWARFGVVIVLRELITAGGVIDAGRGVPVIHLNYLGYDEQAHRRGPDSRFAHWTLRGIDRAIRRVWRAANRSRRREYFVVIYSDHGQERVESFLELHGRTLQDVVLEVVHATEPPEEESERALEEVQTNEANQGGSLERARSLWIGRGGFRQKGLLDPLSGAMNTVGGEQQVSVAAMGPVGHISFLLPLVAAERRRIARSLVTDHGVPAALYRDESGALVVVSEAVGGGREFSYEEGIGGVIGERHPYFAQVKEDLRAMCALENSGDIVCLGWRPNGRPVTFPRESGAHGGPGFRETSAFALLPGALRSSFEERSSLRHEELYQIGRELLRRGEGGALKSEGERGRRLVRSSRNRTITLMTYNVHSCIGLDRKLSPLRIARVISQYAPDIVALQELDVSRGRTGKQDQARLIADELEMEFHFHPALALEEELYGDAILSTAPLELRRAGAIPGVAGKRLEPRGAILVSAEFGGCEIFVLNTHLGLLRREREEQTRALLGEEWLGSVPKGERVVMCGDLNDVRSSSIYRMIEASSHQLRDAQRLLTPFQVKNTWPSKLPLRRIDHVFVSPGLKVRRIEVPRTELTMSASDHLPVIVELEIV